MKTLNFAKLSLISLSQLSLFMLSFFVSYTASAQSVGDYRSASTGNWNVRTNWERWNGSAWVTPTAAQNFPTSAAGAIEVRAAHTMTITSDITLDQVSVNGTLNLNSGVTLSAGAHANMITVSAGSLNVNGTISNTIGSSITSSAANTVFNSGSTYIHDSPNADGGLIPVATWHKNSNFNIEFSSATYSLTSSTWSQAFGNVDINISTSGSPRTHQFSGLLNDIRGNLTISNTGGNPNHRLALSDAGTHVINVGGNFTMVPTNRTLILNSNAAGSATIHIKGDFIQTNGDITTTGQTTLNFNGGGHVQNFTRNAGAMSGALAYSIASNSILDVASNQMEGSGAFNLFGEIRVGIATGLNGILQNTGTKTFHANSTITYNGNTNQVMGTLYPAIPAAGINVVVNKSAGTLSTSLAITTVSGALRLLAGTLVINNVAATNNTLNLNGHVEISAGLLAGNAEAILSIGGAGTLDQINFAPATNTLKRLHINRAAVTVSFGSNFSIREALNIVSGTLNASSHTIHMLGTTWSVNGATGGFVDAGSSTVNFDGNTTVSFACDFHNINLLAGRSLSFPSAQVNVSGQINFDATATFVPNEGTLNLVAALTQHIHAANHTFYNIAVAKSAGDVNITETLNLTSFLNINSATAVMSNGNLVLKSNNDELINTTNSTSLDGKIGPILAGGSVVGDVIVERHIIALPAGGNRLPFRYIAPPVLDADWSGASLLKHNTVTEAAANPELKYNVGSGGWKTHNTASGLQNGEGYRLRAPNATDLVFTGEIASGSITWEFKNAKAAWFMIGNPYPSAIAWLNDIDSSRWEANNISSLIGIYDNFSEGYPNYFRYAYMPEPVDGVPADQWGTLAEQNVIATGQAFWVYVGAGGGFLTIKENAKVSATEIGRFYRRDNARPALHPKQLILNLSDGKINDIAKIQVYTAGSDLPVIGTHDIAKLWNEEMDVYFLNEQQSELLVYGLEEKTDAIEIPIGLNVSKAGNYSISFANLDQFQMHETLYFIDLLERKTIPLHELGTYQFRIMAGSKAINNRFMLSNKAIDFGREAVTVSVYPNPVVDVLNVKTGRADTESALALYDMSGRALYQAMFYDEHRVEMQNYQAGIYILKVRTAEGMQSQRIVKR